jgi:hypothetical protein
MITTQVSCGKGFKHCQNRSIAKIQYALEVILGLFLYHDERRIRKSKRPQSSIQKPTEVHKGYWLSESSIPNALTDFLQN